MAEEVAPRNIGRREVDKAWRIHREVNLPMILGIIIQTIAILVAGTIWVTTTNTRMATIDTSITLINSRLDVLQGSVQNSSVPSAENRWRIESLERRQDVTEKTAAEHGRALLENSRRLSVLEATGRIAKER